MDVDLGVLDGPKPFKQLMSNVRYGFNYVYEDMSDWRWGSRRLKRGGQRTNLGTRAQVRVH